MTDECLPVVGKEGYSELLEITIFLLLLIMCPVAAYFQSLVEKILIVWTRHMPLYTLRGILCLARPNSPHGAETNDLTLTRSMMTVIGQLMDRLLPGVPGCVHQLCVGVARKFVA